MPPGTTPGPGQIVYSNGFTLTAMMRAEGAEVIDLGIVPDRLEDTVAAVRRARAADADVLVTTGGASVGEYDLVQQAFAAEGMTLSFWKIAMRPGRPLMHGRLGPMHVLGLPGNPVSSYVCCLLFVVPLLRRLSGRADIAVETELAAARPRPSGQRRARGLPARDLRRERRRRHGRDAVSGAGQFHDGAACHVRIAWLLRAPFAPAAKAGEPCAIVKLAF